MTSGFNDASGNDVESDTEGCRIEWASDPRTNPPRSGAPFER